MSSARMKTVSQQQACQVAAVEGSATLLNIRFAGLAHLNVALSIRSAEDLLTRYAQHLLLHRTQLPEAHISPHHDVPVSALTPSPPVLLAPVPGSRLYCRHRMESASLRAKEIPCSTSSGSFD